MENLLKNRLINRHIVARGRLVDNKEFFFFRKELIKNFLLFVFSLVGAVFCFNNKLNKVIIV